MSDNPQGPHPMLTEVGQQAARLASELRGPLRRIHVRQGEVEIQLEWDQPAAAAGAPTAVAVAEPPAVDEVPDDGRTLVVSPMVGTYYHAPSPDADPFVSVGDVVEAGQVVGIVEAMKLMNPIVTEHAGTVCEVLAGNGDPVEFGHPLLAVLPA